MCGIAGLLGIPPDVARPAAARMRAALEHRGPDDAGCAAVPDPHGQAPPAMLAHTRLAILDLSPAGHQPMADKPPEAGRPANWIVFNGEVFNFLELQADLARAGWPCHSRCDTEVILHAYRVWGPACVEKLRGMFAWCLLDAERGTAWLCRDRLGIKPLYLTRPAGGGLLFASELRALLAAGPDLVPPRVHPAALESFLAQGAVCGLDSIVEGVELLAPGQSLVTDWAGRPEKRQTYWRVPFTPAAEECVPWTAARREQAVARLADTLRRAVRLRLIADVPVGLFLSGGVDSGALAAVATEVAGTQVRTVSIGFDQPEFDETAAAAAVARALGTRHSCLRLSGADVLNDLPAVLAAIDQPTVDGFNTFFVSRAARRSGLTVALSGLGGDELFGGYASFQDVPRAVRWRKRLRWMGPSRPVLARVVRWVGGRRGVKAAEALTRRPAPLEMYLLRRELFLPGDRRTFHALPAGSDLLCGVPDAVAEELRGQARGLDPVNQVSLFELGAYMRNMLLRDADVFSMAHGLELRVPLLDHELVEQVTQLPGAAKRPDGRPKPLLLDAVGSRLPALVTSGPKRGFTFPWDAWLRGPLAARAGAAVENAAVWLALGFHPDAARRLWQRFVRQDTRVSALQILALIVLEDVASRHRLRRSA
jgi:asparagine synthase (glutamine-hydrolysing)